MVFADEMKTNEGAQPKNVFKNGPIFYAPKVVLLQCMIWPTYKGIKTSI